MDWTWYAVIWKSPCLYNFANIYVVFVCVVAGYLSKVTFQLDIMIQPIKNRFCRLISDVYVVWLWLCVTLIPKWNVIGVLNEKYVMVGWVWISRIIGKGIPFNIFLFSCVCERQIEVILCYWTTWFSNNIGRNEANKLKWQRFDCFFFFAMNEDRPALCDKMYESRAFLVEFYFRSSTFFSRIQSNAIRIQ